LRERFNRPRVEGKNDTAGWRRWTVHRRAPATKRYRALRATPPAFPPTHRVDGRGGHLPNAYRLAATWRACNAVRGPEHYLGVLGHALLARDIYYRRAWWQTTSG